MAVLPGYNPSGVQYVAMATGGEVHSPVAAGQGGDSRVVIDGTPIRVVILALAAAAGLTALKWSGFRFNVGVSS